MKKVLVVILVLLGLSAARDKNEPITTFFVNGPDVEVHRVVYDGCELFIATGPRSEGVAMVTGRGCGTQSSPGR